MKTTGMTLYRISKIALIGSNSQQLRMENLVRFRCIEYQREHLLEAIYNGIKELKEVFIVVSNIKDSTYWKQFTTKICMIMI